MIPYLNIIAWGQVVPWGIQRKILIFSKRNCASAVALDNYQIAPRHVENE